MMLQEEIGQRIKKFRLEKGITQREFATRASLSKGYISQLEKGLTLPSLPNLKETLDVLGIALSEFFSEKNPLKVVYSKSFLGNSVSYLGDTTCIPQITHYLISS